MDVELCIRAIRKNFPQIHIDSVARISGGWDSHVFEVNGDLIFRFPKWPETERSMQKEISLLPELAKLFPVRIPDFRFIGEYDKKVFVGYRKITGLPLASCNYGSGKLADQTAKVITEIHRFPVHKATELKVPKTNWRREYAEFYESVRDKAFPLMNEAFQEKAVSVWKGFLDNEDNFQFEPVFIHRDLSGDAHILCDPERDRITGIIDWGDAVIGDPAIDFTGIYWDCGEEFTRRVLATYAGKVDGTFWERAVFYYKIGAFHEIIYGQLIDDDAHIRNGLEFLSKTLG